MVIILEISRRSQLASRTADVGKDKRGLGFVDKAIGRARRGDQAQSKPEADGSFHASARQKLLMRLAALPKQGKTIVVGAKTKADQLPLVPLPTHRPHNKPPRKRTRSAPPWNFHS